MFTGSPLSRGPDPPGPALPPNPDRIEPPIRTLRHTRRYMIRVPDVPPPSPLRQYRPALLASPHMRVNEHFAIGNFIRDAVAGRTVRVKRDGVPVRSYLYGADAAVWLLRILAAGQPGAIYNVGSDQPVSIAALAEQVASAIGTGSGYVVEGKPDRHALRNRYIPDVDRARLTLGLEVWTPLDAVIRHAAASLADNRHQLRPIVPDSEALANPGIRD